MKVHFFAMYRRIVGGKVVELPAPPGITLRELVDRIVVTYPDLRCQWMDEQGHLYRHVHFFVNGREAPYLPNGLETPLADSDVVKVFPPVAGGSD